MNQWVNGITLNTIIKQSIGYYENTRRTIRLDYNNDVVFDIGDKRHINFVIEQIVDDIEYVLRFLFEKYFNHHYQIVCNLLGDEKAGENWASLLEYGTQNRIIIALQNTGLSRHSASKIYSQARDALNIKEGKLVSVDKALVLSRFKSSSLEHQEIMRLL